MKQPIARPKGLPDNNTQNHQQESPGPKLGRHKIIDRIAAEVATEKTTEHDWDAIKGWSSSQESSPGTFVTAWQQDTISGWSSSVS